MSEQKNYISYNDDSGSINISEDVLAVVAASAAIEVEGVHALHPAGTRDIGEIVNKKALTRTVKTVIDGESVTIDIFIMVDMGVAVGSVAADVQKAVSDAVEAAIGVKPASVNVHISGISLKKNK